MALFVECPIHLNLVWLDSEHSLLLNHVRPLYCEMLKNPSKLTFLTNPSTYDNNLKLSQKNNLAPPPLPLPELKPNAHLFSR